MVNNNKSVFEKKIGQEKKYNRILIYLIIYNFKLDGRATGPLFSATMMVDSVLFVHLLSAFKKYDR